MSYLPANQTKKENLIQEIDNLKYHATMQRWPASKSIHALLKFINENQPGDCLVNSLEKKNNPWIDKVNQYLKDFMITILNIKTNI